LGHVWFILGIRLYKKNLIELSQCSNELRKYTILNNLSIAIILILFLGIKNLEQVDNILFFLT
jgi:hypothetical protein